MIATSLFMSALLESDQLVQQVDHSLFPPCLKRISANLTILAVGAQFRLRRHQFVLVLNMRE